MSEEKEFICTARGVPCDCDQSGCTAKKDPTLRIAEALERIADRLDKGIRKQRPPGPG